MTTNDYPPQAGPWTLKAPDGRFWIGMTPMAAVRAEMNERIPATVQLARINAAIAEDKAEESAEIARLQAQVDALAVALERAKRTMADYGQCDNDNWPCFQAVCAALAAVGR